jgi:hypothetical protein
MTRNEFLRGLLGGVAGFLAIGKVASDVQASATESAPPRSSTTTPEVWTSGYVRISAACNPATTLTVAYYDGDSRPRQQPMWIYGNNG